MDHDRSPSLQRIISLNKSVISTSEYAQYSTQAWQVIPMNLYMHIPENTNYSSPSFSIEMMQMISIIKISMTFSQKRLRIISFIRIQTEIGWANRINPSFQNVLGGGLIIAGAKFGTDSRQ
jgi:hypothetical protein